MIDSKGGVCSVSSMIEGVQGSGFGLICPPDADMIHFWESLFYFTVLNHY